MKVKCIGIRTKYNGKGYENITLGKEYEVIREYKDYFQIIDDEGRKVTYGKELFEEVKEMNKKVKRINTYHGGFDVTMSEITQGKVYEVVEEYEDSYAIIADTKKKLIYDKEFFTTVIEDEGLTFAEVIANIQDGEVWESGNREVSKGEGSIYIGYKDRQNHLNAGMVFEERDKFKLKVREIDFETALKLYYAGKVIKSLESGVEFKMAFGNNHYMKFKNATEFFRSSDIVIHGEEITGKWVEIKCW